MNRPGQRTTPACWCDGRKHEFQPGRDYCGGYPKPAAVLATPLEPKGWKARTSCANEVERAHARGFENAMRLAASDLVGILEQESYRGQILATPTTTEAAWAIRCDEPLCNDRKDVLIVLPETEARKAARDEHHTAYLYRRDSDGWEFVPTDDDEAANPLPRWTGATIRGDRA